MATPSLRPLEPATGGTDPVGRLMELYRNELDIYRRILALAERQGELVRREADFGEIRTVLAEKKRCLDVIARLERDESDARTAWERDRSRFPAEDRGRVHRALRAVADLIEAILAVEEANDNELIQRTGVL
jgi:hypothetical protein